MGIHSPSPSTDCSALFQPVLGFNLLFFPLTIGSVFSNSSNLQTIFNPSLLQVFSLIQATHRQYLLFYAQVCHAPFSSAQRYPRHLKIVHSPTKSTILHYLSHLTFSHQPLIVFKHPTNNACPPSTSSCTQILANRSTPDIIISPVVASLRKKPHNQRTRGILCYVHLKSTIHPFICYHAVSNLT